MNLALDTSCIVNLLAQGERPQPDLLAVVRAALQNRVRLSVTPIVDVEIAKGDATPARSSEHRQHIHDSLTQFPVTAISPEREPERDALAERLLALLWPNVAPGSRKHGNSLRDCKHLASHRLCGGDAFVTLDEELQRKAARVVAEVGLEVLSPSEVARRIARDAGPRAADGAWSPVVRPAREDDKGEIKALLAPIGSSYRDFDAWLRGALASKNMFVGVLDGRIGAVSVWGFKTGTTTVKLSTFFVGDEFQGRGLGPHLLFHQLRHWIEQRASKVFVTVSSERLSALQFFLTYGFRIEGTSARRYKSDAVEFILAKHLLYEVVGDERLDSFLRELGEQVFDLPAHPAVRSASSWFLPPVVGRLRAQRGSDKVEAIDVVGEDGSTHRRYPLDRFEELVYPARFATRGREAYLIPIRPEWADGMIHVPRAQASLFRPSDKLALRTDNAYYLHPRYLDEPLEGAPALFYVSEPDQIVAGFARIVARDIAEPEDLFLKYDQLGVYGIENIRGHVKAEGRFAGCAMAIRFAWWVAFPVPIPSARLRAEFGIMPPMTITGVDYGLYERLLAAGGIKW